MKDFRNSIKGIASVYRPFRWHVAVCVLTGLVNVAASIAFVWASKCLVDIATGVLDKPLGNYVWLMIMIVLLRIACNVAGSYWENLTQIKATNALRLRTFIVNALSRGISPTIVMKRTGHASYSSMKPYIDIVDSIKDTEMAKMNFMD